MIPSAISKLLSADITSVFCTVLFFCPGLHQSLSKELGQSYLCDISALTEKIKMNGQYYCLPPAGHTCLSTQEHIEVDQSGMESVSVRSRKKRKKSHGRGTTTFPANQHKLRVFVQQKRGPPARTLPPELPECCKTPHRTGTCVPDGSTCTNAKINGSVVLLGADTCFSFHIMA